MFLSDDLRYVVEEDENPPILREVFTDPEDIQCLEVVGDFESRSATVHVVEIHDDHLEMWLDCASVPQYQPRRTDRSSRESVRKLHILLLPTHAYPEYRTPFSNRSLRNAINLAGTSFRLLEQGPMQFFEVPVENRGKGLVVRMDGHNERHPDTVSMIAMNEEGTQTCAILRAEETRSMRFLLRRIDELAPYIWHPCILASLQIERRMGNIKEELSYYATCIRDMDKAAGVYKISKRDQAYFRKRGKFRASDSERSNKLRDEFASVRNALLYEKYKCIRFLDFLSFLDDFASTIEDLPEWGIKLRTLRGAIKGYEERATYLSDRAETTMQTCFSLMSEQDNFLNQQAASQALQHSRDMRAITIITLFFLPATFVATFFSTSFFDFNPTEKMVSVWLWLYWIIALTLTAIVLGGWRYWGRFGADEDAGDARDEEKEPADRNRRRSRRARSGEWD